MFASFLGASFYFALLCSVDNLFTSYLLLFIKKTVLPYDIYFYLINKLLITSKEILFYAFADFFVP